MVMGDVSSINGFEETSYIIGFELGKTAGKCHVVLDGSVTCTDDGSANITITAGGN